MPIPTKAYCPDSIKELVNQGWDTNRERDSADGHDRATSDDKLQTALCAFACGDKAAYGEALAMIVEVELELRDNSARNAATVREALQHVMGHAQRKIDAGEDNDGRFLFIIGAMTALRWAVGLTDSQDFQRVLGCSIGDQA